MVQEVECQRLVHKNCALTEWEGFLPSSPLLVQTPQQGSHRDFVSGTVAEFVLLAAGTNLHII